MTTTAPTRQLSDRAAQRLLAELGWLHRPLSGTARERLEHELGADQASWLVAALAGDHRMRVRELELVA